MPPEADGRLRDESPARAAPSQEILNQLAERLSRETQGEVLFDQASRGRYATDASVYQIMPYGVFVPKRESDVEIALACAREAGVPVLPRGGGTSQCGQTVGAALVIDHSKAMRSVIEIDPREAVAEVQPGLVLDDLNAALKPHNLWFPVDVSTSAQATLGGMAGNNSCGSRSLAYGNMVHNVVGIDAWLSNGESVSFGPFGQASGTALEIGSRVRALALAHQAEIENRWPKVQRRVGGYNLDIFHNQSPFPYTADGSVNLAHLLVGSEGTLALTRRLRLKLCALPSHRVLGVVNFPSFFDAMTSAQHIVELSPTAVELVDRIMIDLSLSNPAFKPVIESSLAGSPEALLLVEFAGTEPATLRAQLKRLTDLIGGLNVGAKVVELIDGTAQKRLWEVRKAGLNIMMSLKGDGKPVSFIEDCAVPLEHLAAYTEALSDVFRRHGTHGTWYAHASVGTLHVRPILDLRVDGPQGGAAKMRRIAEEASELVQRFRGAFSGEHGDGICRGEWIAWQFGPQLVEAFRAIKNTMDPIGLMNPGKIIDPPKMDDAQLFRFPPPSSPNAYRRIPIQPVFDWSAWNVQNDPVTEAISAAGTGGDVTGGLAMAVEMCNNNGHCRKFDAGAMCPSYRVTRDEKDLTRGRANTLRLALSGQLGEQGLTHPAVQETLALCVGCKACKRECPTGVDMARIKLEAIAQDRAKHGHRLKDRLIAHLPAIGHWASRVPSWANRRNRSPLLRKLMEQWLGFSAECDLPEFRSDSFWLAPPSHLLSTPDDVLQAARRGEAAALLFVDSFSGLFEPEIVVAALKVMRAAGFSVAVLDPKSVGGTSQTAGHFCCGRTALAAGMPELAKMRLSALLDAYQPFVEAGVECVGLEPSCLLTLQDEALALGLGARANALAGRTKLFESFLLNAHTQRGATLRLKPAMQSIKLHGHCHQKAFGLTSAAVEVLTWIPGAKVELIESSCCGMAGSFGYEAEHRSVSRAMAEQKLWPAVRQAPDSIIAADGTSCRHQIFEGTQRRALHVAQVLAEHLDGSP